MKLELKHLAPYLPYRLKIQGNYNLSVNRVVGMNALFVENGILHLRQKFGSIKKHNWKPILSPLSDLDPKRKDLSTPNTKIMEKLKQDNPTFSNDMIIRLIKCKGLLYKDFELLLENHFDVFGLITKGLAIDINTL